MNKIETALHHLNIPDNSNVMLHGNSSIALSIHKVSKNEKMQGMVNTIINFFENSNTLVVPTFTYSFPNKEIYNSLTSISKNGLFSEYFRINPKMQRTRHPIFSCVTYGPNAELFLNSFIGDCFGEDTVFDLLFKSKGFIVLLGCSFNEVTFTHYIEQKVQVNYRYSKEFSGYIADDSENLVYTNYYVRDLDSQIDTKLDLSRFWLEAKNLEILTYCYLDRLPCISIRSDLFFDLASRMLRENPFALIREGYKNVKKVDVF